MQLDGDIQLKFDLSIDDPSFPSSFEDYTLAYSLHLPSSIDPTLPCFIFSHPFNNSREYWLPQLNDPVLSPHPKIIVDAIGFAHSSTNGRPWSFDLAAYSILSLLDFLDENPPCPGWEEMKFVLVGDSMGGGPTGMRVALRDQEGVKEGKWRKRIWGVVACGTAVEEESADFVKQYTSAASTFASECLSPSIGPLLAIQNLSHNMCVDGYTKAYPAALQYGQSVISRSLELGLRTKEGELKAKEAGEAIIMNFKCLNERKSLVRVLEEKPSLLGDVQILVVHGTEEKAYPFARKYHERSMKAIGEDNAELYIVEGGPHFVTATHWKEVDEKILEWYGRTCRT